jgi:hypothetical protein
LLLANENITLPFLVNEQESVGHVSQKANIGNRLESTVAVS